jgi:hypothetical protein
MHRYDLKNFNQKHIYQQPSKAIFNFLKTRMLLDHAQWILGDIDYFNEHASFAEKISMHGPIKARMDYVQFQLDQAYKLNDSNSEYFSYLFQILYLSIIKLFHRIEKDIHRYSLQEIQDVQTETDESIAEIGMQLQAFQEYQKFLPEDHYENYLIRINSKYYQSYMSDWYKFMDHGDAGHLILRDSIYDNIQAIDFAEQGFVMLDHDPFLEREFDLCINKKFSLIPLEEIKKMHKALLVAWRMECVNSIGLFKSCIDSNFWNDSFLRQKCVASEIFLIDDLTVDQAEKDLQVSAGRIINIALKISNLWIELLDLPFEKYEMLFDPKRLHTPFKRRV